MESTGRPPNLSNSCLVRLIHHFYTFSFIDEHSPKELKSYDDRNFYFVGTLKDGEASEFVIKIYNCLNNLPDVVCGVSELMMHLYNRGFQGTDLVRKLYITFNSRGAYTGQLCSGWHILSPYVPLANNSKSFIGMVTGRELKKVVGVTYDVMDEHTYCVRVVRYVPGEILDDINKKFVTPKLLFEMGQFLGKIDTTLSEGFTNKAISTRVLANFDQMHFLDTFPNFVSSIEDLNRRRLAEKVIAEYDKHMAPVIPSLKKGILHNDAHMSNVIVRSSSRGEYNVIAFIDFDDTVDSCYLFELAAFVTDVIAENVDHSNPIELVNPLISGFLEQFNIKKEITYLYYAVMARSCILAMFSELQYKNEPWNDYLLVSIEPCWKVLELFLKTRKADVDGVWSRAVGKTLNYYSTIIAD